MDVFRRRAASCLFFAYVLLCVVVAYVKPLTTLEIQLLKSIGESNELFVHFASELGDLGSTAVVIFVSIVSSVVLLAFEMKREFFRFIVAVAGSGAITGLSKLLIQRDRPEAMEAELGFYTSSFPSGHTLSATAMYMTLAMIAITAAEKSGRPHIIKKTLLTLASLGVVLIATARVFSVTHFPSDAIAGLLAGLWWTLMAAKVKS